MSTQNPLARGGFISCFGGLAMWKNWFGNLTPKKSEASVSYNLLDAKRIPRHIAIIMDGNGRWAQKRGLPRTLGHRAGADTLREIVRAASDIGVGALTAYAFSTENWKRPAEEVSLLMKLIGEYLDSDMEEMHRNDVQIRFIGKTDELAELLRHKIEKAENLTKNNTGLVLNLAVNYGSRAEITRAVRILAQQVLDGLIKPDEITDNSIQQQLYTSDLPDPDLLIRPSGDLRISNFLLWQCAYTEFWLTDIHWPDFTPEIFIQAIIDFQKRERRFGGLKK